MLKDKVVENLKSGIIQNKIVAEVTKTRLILEKEIMNENIKNEVNYELLRKFDYLKQNDPKIHFKYEAKKKEVEKYIKH